MAHPMKKSASEGANAKMRRMTDGYGLGSGPANNKLAPMDDDEGPDVEKSIGFGSDGEGGAAKPRGDRARRRTTPVNPVATYATGGGVKPQDRAAGGRTKKGTTNVNVIVAPQSGAQTPPPMPPAPPMMPPVSAAPPMPPKPPMAAVPPGAAGLPMAPGAPGGMPPGIIPPRASGGKVMHEDAKEDAAQIRSMVKPSALRHRASGGKVEMTAGAATGVGRLEKIGKEPHNAGKPQAV